MILTFDPHGHRYTLNGRVVPSVTEILRAAYPWTYAGIKPEVLEAAMLRGAAVHTAVRLDETGALDEAALDEDWPEVRGYLTAWRLFRAESPQFSPRFVERPLGHPDGWAGTPDCIGEEYIRATRAIDVVLDLKTGLLGAVREQLAAYAELAAVNGALRHSAHPCQVRRSCLELRPNGTYRRHDPFPTFTVDYARFEDARRSFVAMPQPTIPDDLPDELPFPAADEDTGDLPPDDEDDDQDDPPEDRARVAAAVLAFPPPPPARVQQDLPPLDEEQIIVQRKALTIAEAVLALPLPKAWDEALYRKAADYIQLLGAVEKEIEREHDADCAAAHALWKSLCDRRNAEKTPVLEAKAHAGLINGQLVLFKRRADEAKAIEDARALRAAREREAAAEALRLAAEGRQDEALQVQEDARQAPMPAPPPPAPLPAIRGVATVVTYEYRITNRQAIPEAYFDRILNESRLAQAVKAQGANCTIPGIEVFETAKQRRTGRP